MTVNGAPIKISPRDKREVKKSEPSQTYERKKRPLTEWEQKTYPFLDSDVAGMLEDLLENKVIELPECKRPEEMHRVNDLKYCKFYRIISHPVEKCFVLKDLIMKLARQGRIELDVDEVVAVNCTTISFGSFEPVQVPSMPMRAPCHFSKETGNDKKLEEVKPIRQIILAPKAAPCNDGEGWILVTRRKMSKGVLSSPLLSQPDHK